MLRLMKPTGIPQESHRNTTGIPLTLHNKTKKFIQQRPGGGTEGGDPEGRGFIPIIEPIVNLGLLPSPIYK